jgi:hypothetical protein
LLECARHFDLILNATLIGDVWRALFHFPTLFKRLFGHSSGEAYALKMISKSMMEEKGVVGRVINEIEIHLRMEHTGIVRLYVSN